MSVKSGQAVTVDFTTADPTTGGAADADSTPVGTLVVNGTDNAATVTVTKKATGVYKAAVTLPTLSAGDVVGIRVAATVEGVAGVGVVWTDVADTKRVSDLNDFDGTGATLTPEYDHAKDDVLTPLAVVDGKVDAIKESIDTLKPDEGVLITPESIGDDGLPLGRIMPYGTISAYIGDALQYRFDKIGDADGDFAITLPYGSTWTLVAENPPAYRATTAVITTPPQP